MYGMLGLLLLMSAGLLLTGLVGFLAWAGPVRGVLWLVGVGLVGRVVWRVAWRLGERVMRP